VRARDVVWGLTLAAGAAAVGAALTRTTFQEADADLFRAINAGHGPQADRVFHTATEFGSLMASGSAAAIIALSGRPRVAFKAGAAALTTWVIGQGVKKAVARPRPYTTDRPGTRLLIGEPHATSWPSSHPAVLTTFTRVASRELGLGPAATTALSGLDLTVATSRVYLGVHYPGDVIAGLLMGRAVARLWPSPRRLAP
jgi:membrane-associated phospholipid phosphatase